MRVHICICVCAHVYIHIHTHRNIHKPKHTLINTDAHTSPVDGCTGYFLIFLGHTLCCSAHPGFFFFFYICLTIPLVDSQDCILLNLILKIENLPLCNTIGINHGPFHQTLKPSCTPLVRKSGSTPEITCRKHRASCRHIGNTQKRLVVNTNERLSECDGTPCSLYCKLTLGEDSPGSLAQRKPGDKLDAIHHSPTPAPELLVPLTPHPHKQTHPSSAMQSLSSVPGPQQQGAESLHEESGIYICVCGERTGNIKLYLPWISQQSAGRSVKRGSYEVRASYVFHARLFSKCFLPPYFRSEENGVNSSNLLKSKEVYLCKHFIPRLAFRLCFHFDTTKPAAQTPDLAPLQLQMQQLCAPLEGGLHRNKARLTRQLKIWPYEQRVVQQFCPSQIKDTCAQFLNGRNTSFVVKLAGHNT